MAKSTLSFVCQNCGAAFNRWQGKCESCGEWNTLAEEDTTGATSMPVSIRSKRRGRLFQLETLTGRSQEAPRLSSGMAELDRVTGGGFCAWLGAAARWRSRHRQVDTADAGDRP